MTNIYQMPAYPGKEDRNKCGVFLLPN